jgi:hypothetical protein
VRVTFIKVENDVEDRASVWAFIWPKIAMPLKYIAFFRESTDCG